MRPNFLIIGAQKGGSTWLGSMLSQHPEVFLFPRELHYFNVERNYARGAGWYEGHFSCATRAHKAVGEKTPNYLWVTRAPKVTPFGTHLPSIPIAIHRYVPEARLIAILRNPVDRAVSAVNHYMRYGQLSSRVPIDEYLVGGRQEEAEEFGVFGMGEYARALEAYYQCFSREQLLVLEFGGLVSDPAGFMLAVSGFLEIGVGHPFLGLEERVNEFSERSTRVAYALHGLPGLRRLLRLEGRLPSRVRTRLLGPPLKKQKPSAEARAILAARFAEPNERLFDLVGRRYQW